jgi:predicted HNH restriction endonuclease
MINTGREWDFMEDEVQIEEILTEANAYNLKQEVITTAKVFMKDDPELNKVVAYEMAYIEWIK